MELSWSGFLARSAERLRFPLCSEEDPMNKTEFVQKVAQVSGLSVKDCRKAVEAIFNTDDGSRGVIAEELAKDHKITLPGFGTFETRKRQGREGRNPRTREPMRIPPSKVATFRPGKNLKGLVHV